MSYKINNLKRIIIIVLISILVLFSTYIVINKKNNDNNISLLYSKLPLETEIKKYCNDYVLTIVNEKYYLEKNLDKYIDFYLNNKNYTFKDIVAIVNVGADKEWYSDIEDANTSDRYSILVNKFNRLQDDYKVGKIIEFPSNYEHFNASAEENVYKSFIKNGC